MTGTVSVTRSKFTDNAAFQFGGALYMDAIIGDMLFWGSEFISNDGDSGGMLS